jgi:hypothetical protein
LHHECRWIARHGRRTVPLRRTGGIQGARIKVRFGTFFYLPLAVLDLSLVIRLGFGHADLLVRGLGALMNAVALGTFAVTILGAAIAWRMMNNERKTQHKAI